MPRLHISAYLDAEAETLQHGNRAIKTVVSERKRRGFVDRSTAAFDPSLTNAFFLFSLSCSITKQLLVLQYSQAGKVFPVAKRNSKRG